MLKRYDIRVNHGMGECLYTVDAKGSKSAIEIVEKEWHKDHKDYSGIAPKFTVQKTYTHAEKKSLGGLLLALVGGMYIYKVYSNKKSSERSQSSLEKYRSESGKYAKTSSRRKSQDPDDMFQQAEARKSRKSQKEADADDTFQKSEARMARKAKKERDVKDVFARGGKTNLIAPNGKPSNLTPEQYRLVRTPEFKKWFGDWENDPTNASKVVDKNGEPLAVYHGSNSNDIKKFKRNFDGIFFTDNLEVATAVSGRTSLASEISKEEKQILKKDYPDRWDYKPFFDDLKKIGYKIEINRENVARLYEESNFKTVATITNLNGETSKYNLDYFRLDLQNVIKKGRNYQVFLNIRNPLKTNAKGSAWDNIKYKGKTITTADIGELAEEQKNDGAIIENLYEYYIKSNVFIVFESNQIKLADGTNSKFDPESPDIRYDDGGRVNFYDPNKERLSRPYGDMEKEVLDRVSFNEENFVGNFAWKTPSNKLAVGYLYSLDDFDKDLVKNIRLKNGEKVYRYFNRTTAIGGMSPLIKINTEKGLIYFMDEMENPDYDEIKFETRGTKAEWVSLIEGKFAKGGSISDFSGTLENLYGAKKLFKVDVYWETIVPMDESMGVIAMEVERYDILRKHFDFDTVSGTWNFDNIYPETSTINFYKKGTLVFSTTSAIDWDSSDEGLCTETIVYNNEEGEVEYIYGNDYTGFDPKKEYNSKIKHAIKEMKTYSAVVSIEGYEEYAEEFEDLQLAKSRIQDIKANTNFQVVKGSRVGIGKRVDQLDVIDTYAKGGTLKENLEKELHKLQRDLNSSRLMTYREGDNSESEMARQRERQSKLDRFNEVLKLLNEMEKTYAKGGRAKKEWSIPPKMTNQEIVAYLQKFKYAVVRPLSIEAMAMDVLLYAPYGRSMGFIRFLENTKQDAKDALVELHVRDAEGGQPLKGKIIELTRDKVYEILIQTNYMYTKYENGGAIDLAEYADGGEIDNSEYKRVKNKLEALGIYGYNLAGTESVSDYLSVYSSPERVTYFANEDRFYSALTDDILSAKTPQEVMSKSFDEGDLSEHYNLEADDEGDWEEFAKGGATSSGIKVGDWVTYKSDGKRYKVKRVLNNDMIEITSGASVLLVNIKDVETNVKFYRSKFVAVPKTVDVKFKVGDRVKFNTKKGITEVGKVLFYKYVPTKNTIIYTIATDSGWKASVLQENLASESASSAPTTSQRTTFTIPADDAKVTTPPKQSPTPKKRTTFTIPAFEEGVKIEVIGSPNLTGTITKVLSSTDEVEVMLSDSMGMVVKKGKSIPFTFSTSKVKRV